MRLLLHAGMHRTGSTDLQIFLERNRAALAAAGVRYPGEGRNHQDLAWALFRGDAKGADVAALLPREGDGTTVLSAEDFFIHQDLGWLKAVRKRAEVRVRVYLRRQDDWLNSWYNQHVKWPFHRRKSQMSPKRFLATMDDFHWLDFEATLGRWAHALGEEAVEIAPVERGFAAEGQVEDVIADFVARLGLSGAGLERPASRHNESMPVHCLELARHMGLHDMSPKARMRMNEALKKGLAPHATEARTVFSPAQRNAVLDRFEASNRAAARRFLGREALFLAPRPGPEEPWWEMPEMDRRTLLRDWIRPVMRALAEDG
jgi:capsular polysaccharide export protein